MLKKLRPMVCAGVFGLIAGTGVVAQEAGKPITVPDDFRTKFEFLGAWAVTGTDGAAGQHVVYASPGTVAAYRQTGEFPDGAVLVKELFSGKTEDLTTGKAVSAAETAGYFVMIKDSAGNGKGPLWGDGWGWAYFDASNRNVTTTKDYKADCLGCHEPVRQSDLVFTYGYPVLKR